MRRRNIACRTLANAIAFAGMLLVTLSAPTTRAAVTALGLTATAPLDGSSVVSDHAVAVRGRAIAYRARAGRLPVPDGDGAHSAAMSYVAYTVQAEAAAARPITFVFNGGPGAASAYLNLGGLGPRVLPTTPDGRFAPGSPQLLDNPDTWLDVTDLVFVDPVGTGYSTVTPGGDEARFWGVEADAASIGAFVRAYLAATGRFGSPVSLVGESYGGFRATLVARDLQKDERVHLAGLVLVSPALEFVFLRPDEFDILHLALELPSLAAVEARREGLSGPAFQARLGDAERFALSDYLVALAAGLDKGRDLASRRVAELTGLPLDLVQHRSTRIPTGVFLKAFGRVRGTVLSPYDGTVEQPDPAPAKPWVTGPDAILGASVPVLTDAFERYARDELGVRADAPYRVLNDAVSRQWNYGIAGHDQGYAGVVDDLQRVREADPDLQVLIVNGNTDLVTPYAITGYLVDQVAPIPRARPIRLAVLDGGHMMYLRPDSRRALKAAAAELYVTSTQ